MSSIDHQMASSNALFLWLPGISMMFQLLAILGLLHFMQLLLLSLHSANYMLVNLIVVAVPLGVRLVQVSVISCLLKNVLATFQEAGLAGLHSKRKRRGEKEEEEGVSAPPDFPFPDLQISTKKWPPEEKKQELREQQQQQQQQRWRRQVERKEHASESTHEDGLEAEVEQGRRDGKEGEGDMAEQEEEQTVQDGGGGEGIREESKEGRGKDQWQGEEHEVGEPQGLGGGERGEGGKETAGLGKEKEGEGDERRGQRGDHLGTREGEGEEERVGAGEEVEGGEGVGEREGMGGEEEEEGVEEGEEEGGGAEEGWGEGEGEQEGAGEEEVEEEGAANQKEERQGTDANELVAGEPQQRKLQSESMQGENSAAMGEAGGLHGSSEGLQYDEDNGNDSMKGEKELLQGLDEQQQNQERVIEGGAVDKGEGGINVARGVHQEEPVAGGQLEGGQIRKGASWFANNRPRSVEGMQESAHDGTSTSQHKRKIQVEQDEL